VQAVIIVPGIGGNEIWTPPAFFLAGQRGRIWLDYLALLAGGWQLLALRDDGITPDFPFTGQLQPGQPLPEYYGQLQQFLQSYGFHAVGAQLDWRQVLARDGDRLVSQIRQLESYGPVHLVGHSRGGLVMRQALAQLDAAGELGRVGRCITLGTPHYGSWAACGMIAGWEQTIGLINHVLTGASIALATPLLIRPVMRVVCSWPAPYELLPSPAAPGISQGEVGSAYAPHVYEWAGSEARPLWINHARTRWQTAPGVPSSVEWVNVVGVQCPTPTRLVRLDRLDLASSWEVTNAGDGVVPAAWAAMPNSPVVYSPTGHSAMTTDPRVLDAIRRHLTERIRSDEVLGGATLDWGCLG
jgi:pimeloyl-ACP methyl ester carboxylesterase